MQGVNNVTFNCTSLVGTNKTGTLKPNSDGYYPVVLGAFDMYNHTKQYWPLDMNAKEIFKASSRFMRRIKRAALRGEYGHPKRDGMSMMDYTLRLGRIDERYVAFHIKEVWLDYTGVKDKNGKPCIAIMGLIKPSGPLGHVLKEQLNNPHENVCFSIRAVTVDRVVGGRYEKSIQEIVTWDYVNEPGIPVAEKYHAPSLESLEELVVPTSVIMSHVERSSNHAVAMSLESDDGFTTSDLRRFAESAMLTTAPSTRPQSSKW